MFFRDKLLCVLYHLVHRYMKGKHDKDSKEYFPALSVVPASLLYTLVHKTKHVQAQNAHDRSSLVPSEVLSLSLPSAVHLSLAIGNNLLVFAQMMWFKVFHLHQR